MTHGEHKGRTAVVTGAARGVGAGVARVLSSQGARVVLIARSEGELEELAAELRESGGEAVVLAADLTSEECLSELETLAPEVDLLVNAAASFAQYAPLEEVSSEELRSVYEVGVEGALRLTRHVLGGMKARGFGRIIHIGSVVASLGGGGQVSYSTAKAAFVVLTRAVAVEGGRSGVTANLLELGLVETERVAAKIDPVIQERLIENTPVGRSGSVEEIARVVAFLCSTESGYITGAVLPVSGGLGLGLYREQFPEGGRPTT